MRGRRVVGFELTGARLDAAAKLAKEANTAARVLRSPKAVVTHESVAW